MANRGTILKLPNDERNFIVYQKQQFLKDHSKVCLHIVDDSYNPIIGENGLPKMIFKQVDLYNELLQSATLVGYVD